DSEAEMPSAGAPPAESSSPTDRGAESDPDAVERRAFVRKMTTDAVGIAGTLFNFSRILTRSAVAAGEAVMGELEGLQLGNAAEEPAGQSETTATEGVAVEDAPGAPLWAQPAGQESPGAVASPAPPEATIGADQRAILEATTSAVVAVNREGFPPQLTVAAVLWDGETLRFATLGWSRRTTMLRADPHLGFLIEGPGDGRFLTVAGRAQIQEGHDAKEAIWPLLLRDAGDDGE